ncbi:uncharacterized protein FIESC28_11159 [Fusarium coffeatum]|uniref:DUF7908 domain-containing protein n=1 Tax=Fusarium coffeatum TaxID=231269 RepID=A0A366QMI9_9HYPO|nr:uncharacterized protein FIESC28_11159 [Fusarium coffeatum]RBR06144.1 hypothetical protein FIESC28_11159 [Fusarium coffeatum]
MRRPAFVYTVLGCITIVSAVDYAPVQDTWCQFAGIDKACQRVRETADRSVSEANICCKHFDSADPGKLQHETPSYTELPTSIVVPESSRAAGLSSNGPELSTLDTETTVAQSGSVTQSLNPITEPVIDEGVTSSLSTELNPITSTDAIPTSSGFVESVGRSVIFRISVVDNQKRSTNKRQAIGGFVGNDNPQSCTFAATFNLTKGQLFEGGAAIYYSGESYKELSGLDFPSSGSITQTFEDTGRLVFRNSALPNGKAGFCQTPDGIVYVTFTNGPVGCISVELVVYDVTQCQDGRLIGDDDETAILSDTIPQDTATPRETDPPMTSVIEDTTTVRVSYSSNDFMTQSELIGTSLTSDLGASDMASSETPQLPASSKSAATSISHSGSTATPDVQLPIGSDLTSFSSTTDAPDGTSSIPSTQVDTTLTKGTLTDTIATDTTVIDTILIDTTNTDTTIIDTVLKDTTTIDPTIMDRTITDTAITVTAIMDVTITDTTTIDITLLTTGTIGMDFTTGDTTDITTTAASTATADASATSPGTANPACTDTNNPYTASNGVTFTLACNTFIGAALLQNPYLSDFIPCLQACSKIQACLGISLYRSSSINSYCYLWSFFDAGSAEDSDSWDIAFKDAVIADTTTAAPGTETTDTTTADSITADTTTADTTTANSVTTDTTDTTTADTTTIDTTTANSITADTTTADTTTADTTTADTTTADTTTADTTTANSVTTDTTTADTTTADTTTADIPTSDATTPAAPTETSGLLTCEDLSSPLQVGDDTYDIFCNGFRFLTAATDFVTASFLDCIQACSQNDNCIGVVYVEPNLRCYLAFAYYSKDFLAADGYHLAIRQRT